MPMHQMDVKSAFLYGDIKGTVYLKLPEGLKNNGRFLKLNKSIYGLKSSPKNWNEKPNNVLLKEGFNNRLYVLVYVDDLLILGTNEIEIQNLKKVFFSKISRCKISERLATTWAFILLKIKKKESSKSTKRPIWSKF